MRNDEGGLGTGAAGHAEWLVGEIQGHEGSAEKSLMHRFNLANEVLARAAPAGEPGMLVLFAWLRYFSTRKLPWNKNYNIKPRVRRRRAPPPLCCLADARRRRSPPPRTR